MKLILALDVDKDDNMGRGDIISYLRSYP